MTSNTPENKPFILDKLIEIIYGVRIFLSPALIGLILGLLVHMYFKNTVGIVLGIVLLISGIIIGLIHLYQRSSVVRIECHFAIICYSKQFRLNI